MYNYFHFLWPFYKDVEGMSGDRLCREVHGIVFAAMSWSVMFGFLLFYFGLSLTSYQQLLGLVLIFPGSVIVAVIASQLVLRRDLKPIKLLLNMSETDRDPIIESDGLIQVYNFQKLSAMRILMYQLPAFGLTFMLLILVSNTFLDLNLNIWQLSIALLGATMVGTAHAVFEFYAVANPIQEMIVRIRKHVPSLTAEQTQAITKVTMKQKLLWVSLLIVLPNTVILGSTMLIQFHVWITSGASNEMSFILGAIGWVVLFVVVATALSVFVFLRMADDITGSAKELTQAMEDVKSGQFNVALVEKTTDEFAHIYTHFNRMVGELMERERLRDAMGRYVAKDLAEDVMKHGLSLGGKEVHASVLFADIRDFTAMSESMTSQQVVDILNQYFSAMEPAIESGGGWINKFGGDSLLAVFGVLPPDTNHVSHAVRSALEMREALVLFNKKQQQQGKKLLKIGIGIHVGKMVAGNVGSHDRMEYTVIGDTVNTASRIEGLNKEWGTDILISEYVMKAMNIDVAVQAMPKVHVQGISDAIQVFAVK